MTTPPVTFVYADFIAAYPIFTPLGSPLLQMYFDMSDAFFENNTCNFAFCTGIDRMTRLAYMVTAHIAWLFCPKDVNGNPAATGNSQPGTVGQITTASQGSVSVSLADVAKGGANELAAWYAQTPYGFLYWQATAQFRTARYLANPTRVVGITPFPIGARFGRRGW
jgi:hypothetical protein